MIERKDETQKELWKKTIDQFNQSGLSLSAYSKQHNIPVHKLYYWRDRLSENSNQSQSPLIKVLTQNEEKSSNSAGIPDPIWLGKLIRSIYENL